MKAIIGGYRYDTDTAQYLGEAESTVDRGNFHWWRESLYKTKNGRYFLDGEGGALSHYQEPYGTNGHTGGGKITPMNGEEAMHWAEKHGLVSLLEQEFSDFLKDA